MAGAGPGPAVPELRIDTVLAPVDGSDAAADSVDHAAAVADRYGADVHVLYVLDPEQADDHGTAASDARSFLDGVREACGDVDVTCSTAVGFSTGRLTRHPGSVVLDCADEVGADFVVVPREDGENPGILAKAAEYVLSYASQPVLSV